MIENEGHGLYFSEDEKVLPARIALTPILFLDQPGFDPTFHTCWEWVYNTLTNNIMYNTYSGIKSYRDTEIGL